MNVPETYARVCSACPEAEIPGLELESEDPELWSYTIPSLGVEPEEDRDPSEHWKGDAATEMQEACVPITHAMAIAFIESAWANLLKPYHMMHKDLNGEWAIVELLPDTNMMRYIAHGANRLETLEAYIMAELVQRSVK